MAGRGHRRASSPGVGGRVVFMVIVDGAADHVDLSAKGRGAYVVAPHGHIRPGRPSVGGRIVSLVLVAVGIAADHINPVVDHRARGAGARRGHGGARGPGIADRVIFVVVPQQQGPVVTAEHVKLPVHGGR